MALKVLLWSFGVVCFICGGDMLGAFPSIQAVTPLAKTACCNKTCHEACLNTVMDCQLCEASYLLPTRSCIMFRAHYSSGFLPSDFPDPKAMQVLANVLLYYIFPTSTSLMFYLKSTLIHCLLSLQATLQCCQALCRVLQHASSPQCLGVPML